MTRPDPHAAHAFTQEPDASAGHWCHQPGNTQPEPDMVGPYARHRPLPTEGIQDRHAYIVGGGLAGLATAFYLIRDGHLPAERITILEDHDVEGGSLDGAGNPEEGYLVRGGREMNGHYDNFWDLFQDVPALELPDGYSVLDEYRLVNDADPNYSKARLLHHRGRIKDFATFGLSRAQQWELIRLLLRRKDELDDITVEEYFSPGFLDTNFWTFWRTMFAFQNWHSVLEMKLYMHRFLDAIDGLNDMSALVFPKYNQYDSFVRPLADMLRQQGVRFQLDTRVHDLDLEEHDGRLTVRALHCRTADGEQRLEVAPRDLVLALTGSMTEGTAYGDMDTVPVPRRGRTEPGEDSAWTLWRNLAAKSPVFGRPDKFYGDTDRSSWESATLTCAPSPLVDKLKELSVNDPYSGRTATGGIVTITDSAWLMSFTCNRQPHFPDQPDDLLVLWVYALRMTPDGDYVKKPMPECTGREIVTELCHHLDLLDDLDTVLAHTKVRTALMPYITAEFMPRAAGDRPRVVPEGCTNLGLLGQFVETPNDVVFTMESSVRTARVAVYRLLGLNKAVPDISPTQYDIRNLLKAARALNNGRPFPGERLLHRLLDRTYFAPVLPPLPDDEEEPAPGAANPFDAELSALADRGGEALKDVRAWFTRLRDNLRHDRD
ncbi:MAG: oleate hydratase [Alcanivorax sp.]|nr:oleate hydratase [Alcanivorax sp.]MAY12117.1 oleate hydratase [Alcanivorax sp.]MBI54418.1 oleate hydratase [Alcanivorax sp.]MBU60122.1 oleate hydratase [Alcanivorax sp.]HCE41049.1 oleate hydratase [Alcanivorax sp.]